MSKGIDVPCAVNTTGLSLVQPGLLATRIKTNHQRANTKRPHTTTLCVPLLHTGNILGDVLDADGIFDGQTMALGLQTGLVDQDTGIGVETGEGEADVRVDQGDFRGRDARVLQFHGAAFFAAQDYDVGAFDAYGAGAALHGFEGIFDLEDVTVGGEDWGSG